VLLLLLLLTQYIMMLEHCVLKDQEMDLRDYAAALPPLHVLVRQYRVHPGIAWMLWRPVVAALEPQLMARLEVSVTLMLFLCHFLVILCYI
jgi:hypothetical protein